MTRAEIVSTARVLVMNLAQQVDKLNDSPVNAIQAGVVRAALKLTLPALRELQRELKGEK